MTLKGVEFAHASYVGLLRHLWNRTHNIRDRYGFNGDPWGTHIEAACAEYLVARETRTHWVGVIDGKDDGRDVGEFGVRHTTLEDGCLILHPEDEDNRKYLLVVGRAPSQRIVGSILGRDGKQDCWWHDYSKTSRPAYFVPQSALNPKWRDS